MIRHKLTDNQKLSFADICYNVTKIIKAAQFEAVPTFVGGQILLENLHAFLAVTFDYPRSTFDSLESTDWGINSIIVLVTLWMRTV